MKKALKWLALSTVFLLALLLAGSFITHQILTRQDEAAYPPPGQLVAVNGHRLHVYSEGEGELTLVFLSGSGTTAPTLDFKGLYSRLSDDYRIAVVERAGYGWSDDGATPRDIETVLAETRLALQLAGESPPYVLFPHSMSGLEALHWASRYPDEVTAIVGLDPAVPQIYELLPPPRLMLSLITFSARTGLIRLGEAICHESAAVATGQLTAEETDAYCSLFYRRTLTANMLAEIAAAQDNAQLVAAEGLPDVPLYFFISDGSDLPLDNWGELLAAYAAAAGGQHLRLDAAHYLHNLAPDQIAQESRAFLQNVATELNDR